MIDFTFGEQKFIESGGLLFCAVKKIDERWDIFSISNNEKKRFPLRPCSDARADEWVFALAAVSSLGCNVNVHHSIMRRNADESFSFPIL